MSTFKSWNPQNVWQWKIYCGQGGCKNVCWISLSFACYTHASCHILSRLQVKNSVFDLKIFILRLCCMCGGRHTFTSENRFFLCLVFWGRNDAVYLFSTWKRSTFTLCRGLQQYNTRRWLRERLQPVKVFLSAAHKGLAAFNCFSLMLMVSITMWSLW